MKRVLDIIQFSLSTSINLHILTCAQIVLSTHREFNKSWMNEMGVSQDDFVEQYIISIYFVTTTLSTCGFGDIKATKHDATEHGVILLL